MSPSPATPRHLWIVGILALLWNAVGAYDYLMTETRNEAYMAKFTPEQLDYFYAFPTWVIAAWALAVWGGVLGAVLLLMRNRFAVPVLVISLIGMVGTTINTIVSGGFSIMGGIGPTLFTLLIFVISVGLLLYARRMQSSGVLR